MSEKWHETDMINETIFIIHHFIWGCMERVINDVVMSDVNDLLWISQIQGFPNLKICINLPAASDSITL